MADDSNGRVFNGGLSTTLRNLGMVIGILVIFASAVIAVTSRASKPELAAVKERVKVVEVKGEGRDKQLDKIEEKIDKLLERKQ